MRRFLTFVILASFGHTLSAQTPVGTAISSPATTQAGAVADTKNGKIEGVVIDEASREPIAYATVALINPETGHPIDGTIADDQGKFSMNKVPQGEYTIQISFLGYEAKNIKNVLVGDKKVDLGEVGLQLTEKVLEEVTVEGQRAMFEEKVDRTVYNAEVDASNRGGDATDVLRKVPMLSVDLDGNVSMRGSQNIRVLINNRPSTITAGSIADALKQIPADMIKSVEVITSPSAKYDAEGSAGIINIVTKKNTLQGGTLNINTGVGLRGSNLGLNGNYRLGKMGFSLGGFGRVGYNMPGSFTNTQTTITEGDVNVIQQEADTRNNMMFGRYTFGWDYDINEKNYVNGSVQYGLRNGHNFQDNLVSNYYENDQLLNRSLRNVEMTDNSGTVDVDLNYTHTFDKPQHEISLLSQYSRNNRTNDFLNEVFNSEESGIDYRLKNINQSYNQETTVQLDYTNPIFENQLIELGGKQIMRQVTSDYELFTALGQGPFTREENASLSNVFRYDQNVSAGYFSYTLSTANKFSVKAGARYEYTSIQAGFRNSDEEVNISPYGVLVPSVNLSKTLKGGSTVKLAYNRRIQRPSLQFLNPNIQNPNPAFRTVGNPELDPEFTNNFELSYNTYFKIASLNLTSFVRSTNNSIQAVRERSADGVLETTYYNIGQEQAYGGSVFGNINLARKFTLSGGSDFYYADLTNNVADVDQRASNSGWVVNLRAFANYKLGQGWGLQGFGFYRSGQVQLQGYQGGFGIYSLNLQKEFNEGKGSIGFGAENFFSNTIKVRNELNTPTFSQSSVNVMHNMNFKVNFSYRIGKMSADAGPRRRRKSVNNDDLKSGGESGIQEGGAPQGGAPQGGTPRGGMGGGAPQGSPPQGVASGQFPRSGQKPDQSSEPSGQNSENKPSEANDSIAVEINGRWQGSMAGRPMELDLQAEGTGLSGTVQTPMGPLPISEGVIEGSRISFNVSFGGTQVPHKGRIEGDKMYLTFHFQGQPMEAALERVQ